MALGVCDAALVVGVVGEVVPATPPPRVPSAGRIPVRVPPIAARVVVHSVARVWRGWTSPKYWSIPVALIPEPLGKNKSR